MIWERYDKEKNTDVFRCIECGVEMSGTFPRECERCGRHVADLYEIVQLTHKNTVMLFKNGAPLGAREMDDRLTAEELRDVLAEWYNDTVSALEVVTVERRGILARQSRDGCVVTLNKDGEVVRCIETDGRRRSNEELKAYIDQYLLEMG